MPRSAHRDLWIRSAAGTAGFTAFVFAVKLLPLGIHSIVFNTAPFVASLLGWLMLKEKPATLELFLMCISFGGVIIIGTAKPIN